jgi:hypothetical protein
MEIIKPGYTRVSEIIAQWPKYEGIDPKVLQAKAEIGTNVHRAISAYIKDNLVLPLTDIEEGYCQSFFKWYNTIPDGISESELRLYDHNLKITGGIDLLIQYNDQKKFTLYDFKTSAVEDAFSWKLQAGLYHWLCQVDGFEMNDQIYFVQLSRYGNIPKIFNYQMTFDLLNACMAAVTTYRFRQNFLT